MQKQKDELCSQIRDLSVNLTPDTVPELKKQVRHLEGVAGQRAEAVTKLTATVEQQQQVSHFNLSLIPPPAAMSRKFRLQSRGSSISE